VIRKAAAGAPGGGFLPSEKFADGGGDY